MNSKTYTYPSVVTIAGFDGSGGAGIQADMKTISALGCYATSALTALPVQNTTGVKSIFSIPEKVVEEQLETILEDIFPDAVKIGMVHTSALVKTIVEKLSPYPKLPVVFDPVMVATSGSILADEDTIASFAALMDIATVVTPNLPELGVLAGRETIADDEVFDAAAALASRFGVQVLAKGGHAGDETQVVDRIVSPSGKLASFAHARIQTRHTHGTGCTLSSALATMLGYRQPLVNAVRIARAFTYAAIENAPGFGEGSGPMGHQAVRKLEPPEEIPR